MIGFAYWKYKSKTGRTAKQISVKVLQTVSTEGVLFWGAFSEAQSPNFARTEARTCERRAILLRFCRKIGARRLAACLESHKTDLFLVIKNIDVH